MWEDDYRKYLHQELGISKTDTLFAVFSLYKILGKNNLKIVSNDRDIHTNNKSVERFGNNNDT